MNCPLCGWAEGNGHNPAFICGQTVRGDQYLKGRQETSQEAWEDIQNDLPAARAAALMVLNAAGGHGVTGGEANANLAKGEGNPSYHRRLAELVDTGLAVRSHKRACAVSGRMAWVYVITPKGLLVANRRTP